MATLGRIASGFGFMVFTGLCLIAVMLFNSTKAHNELVPGSQPNSIGMVNPSGVNPERDYAYSQTNLNNSQSNVYNANADGVEQIAKAQAYKLYAEACDIRNDCFAGERAANQSALNTILLSLVGVIGIFVIGFVVMARRAG
jgi:hypothetical protein